jgi:Tfp pilus assembly protein FimT
MRAAEGGVTLAGIAVVLAALAALAGVAAPAASGALDGIRATGAVAELFEAIHLTRARARATGVMHALVLEPDGRGFRIVEDPGGTTRTVEGPHPLPEGAVATANATIRFSPKGFAVPAGTLTVQSGDAVRRLVVNLLGRVRIAAGPAPG